MARNSTEAINSYITDMEALEEHLEKALHAQVADLRADYPELVAHLQPIRIHTQQHLQVLKALTESREIGAGHAVAEAVKRAGAMVAGLGAAAVDLVRNEKMPKDLRDDYAAIGVATIGYVMLMTTARSLGDDSVADMAERHLRDYAEATMTLHNIIPAAVIKFLHEEGLPAREDVLPELGRDLHAVWSAAPKSGAVPEVDEAVASR